MKGWRDGALPAASVVPVVLNDRDGGDGGGGVGGELDDERPLPRRHESGAAVGHAHPQPGRRQHLQPQAAPGQRLLHAPSRPQPPRAPRLRFCMSRATQFFNFDAFQNLFTKPQLVHLYIRYSLD